MWENDAEHLKGATTFWKPLNMNYFLFPRKLPHIDIPKAYHRISVLKQYNDLTGCNRYCHDLELHDCGSGIVSTVWSYFDKVIPASHLCYRVSSTFWRSCFKWQYIECILLISSVLNLPDVWKSGLKSVQLVIVHVE